VVPCLEFLSSRLVENALPELRKPGRSCATLHGSSHESLQRTVAGSIGQGFDIEIAPQSSVESRNVDAWGTECPAEASGLHQPPYDWLEFTRKAGTGARKLANTSGVM
jgi:hypothetical protein